MHPNTTARAGRPAGLLCWTIAAFSLLALLAPLASPLAADDAGARKIVERADRANTPPFMVETMSMTLVDEHGKRFERRLRLWTRKGEDGDLDLMRFLAPDELRGTGLLTLEHRGATDDQWLYLPATRRIRRIAGADRRDRFLGTEFLYEDLQGYHPEDYTFRGLREEKVDGETCHVIEAKSRDAKAAARSAYSRKVLWIGEKTQVLRRAELYGEDGKLLKTITSSEVEEVLPGIFVPGRVLAENRVNGRSTTLETTSRELPGSLPAQTFTQRNLRRRLRPDER